MVIHFCKLYAMKTSSGNEKKKYGITLKAVAIECTNKTVPKFNPCVVLFDDDDYHGALQGAQQRGQSA